jgi:hypothetical protein
MPRTPGWFEPVRSSVRIQWPDESAAIRAAGAPGPAAGDPEVPVQYEDRAVSPAAPAPDQPMAAMLPGPLHATGPRVAPQSSLASAGPLKQKVPAAGGHEPVPPTAAATPEPRERWPTAARRNAALPDPVTHEVPRATTVQPGAVGDPGGRPVAREATRSPERVEPREAPGQAPPVWERRDRLTAAIPASTGRDARQAAPALPTTGPAAANAPHTIEVSIGRIEVRATPAAEAGGKRRAAPATMTLDEYLRRRAGGAGR